MLIVLRIIFGAALLFAFGKASRNADIAPHTGDLTNALYLAVCVLLAIANAVVWAPFIGAKVADPLTGVMLRINAYERKNRLLRLARWLQARRRRRLALGVCFWAGVLRPEEPAAFVTGLSNTRPGSWLEKIFALEVFRFENAQHCVEAYHALRRHGIDPRPHASPQINLVLLSLDRQVKAAPDVLPVPASPDEPTPVRDERIRLFDGAEPPRAEAATGALKQDD